MLSKLSTCRDVDPNRRFNLLRMHLQVRDSINSGEAGFSGSLLQLALELASRRPPSTTAVGPGGDVLDYVDSNLGFRQLGFWKTCSILFGVGGTFVVWGVRVDQLIRSGKGGS